MAPVDDLRPFADALRTFARHDHSPAPNLRSLLTARAAAGAAHPLHGADARGVAAATPVQGEER